MANSKNPKFAIAPKGKYDNGIISRKKYKIIEFDGFSFTTENPSMTCLVKDCAHMRNGKNWILRNK